MTFHLDLGAETFSSANFDLNLALHASAVFSTPPGIWDLWSTEESFRKELITGNIWVDQGACFQLHLYISFDSEPDLLLCSSYSKFASRLGEVLGKSKFWSELGLEVSFDGSNNSLHAQHLPLPSYLSFNFRKSTRKSPALKTPRIPTALQSPCDAPRVDMAPTMFLSSITVRLEYTCTRQILPSRSFTETAPTYNTIYNCPAVPISLHNSTVFPFNPPQIFTDKFQYIENECEVFYCLLTETELLPGPESNPMSSSRELNTLLDTALITLIAGARNPTRKGRPSEQGSQEQPLIPLYRIAPSIFSPGYRDSMNQRVQFIPSIAKSITSIIKHSGDPTLQSNTIRFQCSSPSEPEAEAGISNAHGHEHATMGLKSKLKASLWRVAANRVLTAQGSRKQKHSSLILVPEVEANSEDGQSFEDEILFAATPIDGIESSLKNEIDGDGEDSDRYLGTEEGDSVCGESDAESFETIDDEFKDTSVDSFAYRHSEIGRVDESLYFPGESACHGPQHIWEGQADDLKPPESPILLSDESICEDAGDQMLWE